MIILTVHTQTLDVQCDEYIGIIAFPSVWDPLIWSATRLATSRHDQHRKITILKYVKNDTDASHEASMYLVSVQSWT